MKDYFTTTMKGRVYMTGGRVVDLSSSPPDALELYVNGFPYLKPTPKATELFQKLTKEELKYLIGEKKKNKLFDEVKLLEKAFAPNE